MNRTDAGWIVGVVAVGILCLTGCGPGPQEPPAALPPAEAAAPIVASPAALAMLARADRVDGSEDHVVSRCSNCRLGMEGKAEHAVKVGDYSLQFCSQSCQDQFAKHPDDTILALNLPEDAGGVPSN